MGFFVICVRSFIKIKYLFSIFYSPTIFAVIKQSSNKSATFNHIHMFSMNMFFNTINYLVKLQCMQVRNYSSLQHTRRNQIVPSSIWNCSSAGVLYWQKTKCGRRGRGERLRVSGAKRSVGRCTLLETFWWILLHVTNDSIAKLYMT